MADSAYSDEASANQAVQRLQIAGYPEAGKFWIQDYPNLSGKALYQVYPARFRDRASCANFIQVYRQYSSDAYCVFGSNNPNVSPDRF